MGTQLQHGQRVTVNAFGGKRPTVIVVEDRGEVVLICKPEEFERAKTEKREPVTVGFHKKDVVVDAQRKGIHSEVLSDQPRTQAGD